MLDGMFPPKQSSDQQSLFGVPLLECGGHQNKVRPENQLQTEWHNPSKWPWIFMGNCGEKPLTYRSYFTPFISGFRDPPCSTWKQPNLLCVGEVSDFGSFIVTCHSMDALLEFKFWVSTNPRNLNSKIPIPTSCYPLSSEEIAKHIPVWNLNGAGIAMVSSKMGGNLLLGPSCTDFHVQGCTLHKTLEAARPRNENLLSYFPFWIWPIFSEWHSMKSCLVHRNPYNELLYNPYVPKNNWVVFHHQTIQLQRDNTTQLYTQNPVPSGNLT